MRLLAASSDRLQLAPPRSDQGLPGGAAGEDLEHKHRHDDDKDFTEKDAGTGAGSRRSRESRQGSDDIEGKDGGTNRAGDERGWNAKEQPRDSRGRFISEERQKSDGRVESGERQQASSGNAR